jgi:hypothetical protein
MQVLHAKCQKFPSSLTPGPPQERRPSPALRRAHGRYAPLGSTVPNLNPPKQNPITTAPASTFNNIHASDTTHEEV